MLRSVAIVCVVPNLIACAPSQAQNSSEASRFEERLTSAEISYIDEVLGVASGDVLKRITTYCDQLTPAQPNKIQEVDGYVYDSITCSRSSSCLGPLLKGYRYVEFEASLDVLGGSLPAGKYRIDSKSKPDPACEAYQRFFEEDYRVRHLENRNGESFCVGLSRLEDFESEFERELTAKTMEVSQNISLRIVNDRIIRRSNNEILGEQKRVWIDDEDARWGLHYESPKSDIAEAVIPPVIPAISE